MSKKVKDTYQNHIHRVFEYIDENLAVDLSLNIVAGIAFISPYHFHRIFKFVTGETLNKYVTRKRVEQATATLLHSGLSITEIALKYGFNDLSSFSRTFHKYYGCSPTEFKKQHPNRFSKIRQVNSKNGQTYPTQEQYICIIDDLKKWIKMNAKIEVKQTPEINMAYLSSIGSKNLGPTFQRLLKWATPKGLFNQQLKMATVYHDSFKITDADKVRMSAGIILQSPIEADDTVQKMTIPAGKHIIGSFEIGVAEFEKSWTGLFLWMNENGYEKADRDPFEIYHNDFNKHPELKCVVDFYIPVR
ncbi:MAG: AraC family transcriptional regulator [Saprospiraceae bacterium]